MAAGAEISRTHGGLVLLDNGGGITPAEAASMPTQVRPRRANARAARSRT